MTPDRQASGSEMWEKIRAYADTIAAMPPIPSQLHVGQAILDGIREVTAENDHKGFQHLTPLSLLAGVAVIARDDWPPGAWALHDTAGNTMTAGIHGPEGLFIIDPVFFDDWIAGFVRSEGDGRG